MMMIMTNDEEDHDDDYDGNDNHDDDDDNSSPAHLATALPPLHPQQLPPAQVGFVRGRALRRIWVLSLG